MAHTAIAPSALFADTVADARIGRLPASIGALGAGLGLFAMSPILAPASVPMSVLGVVLARRSGDHGALALGGLGVVLAMSALFQSGAVWVFALALANGSL